jgi:hypothetical protein
VTEHHHHHHHGHVHPPPGLAPGDFWVACGHHLCDRDEDGRIHGTPDLWRAFCARPELVPPPEACDAERALHAALLADPLRAVPTTEIAALADADARADLDAGPVVVVLPSDQVVNTKTPAGRSVVVCPATIRDDVSCATCQLCQRQRSAIVGFPAHGSRKRVINIRLAA